MIYKQVSKLITIVTFIFIKQNAEVAAYKVIFY